MKPAKVPHVILTPDQQLNLLTAKTRAGDRRVRAAEQKTRLAKAKLKSARKAYKLAKKALKNIAKLTKQAHKELAKWQKHSAKEQKRDHAKPVVKAKSASSNKRKRVPAPKPPTVVDLSPSTVVLPATPTAMPEPPRLEQDNRTTPPAESTPTDPATES